MIQFISSYAMKKATQRPFRWNSIDIAVRPCSQEDIHNLFWIMVNPVPHDLVDLVRDVRSLCSSITSSAFHCYLSSRFLCSQHLQQLGEVRGQYPRHICHPDNSSMVKFYWSPYQRINMPKDLYLRRPNMYVDEDLK